MKIVTVFVSIYALPKVFLYIFFTSAIGKGHKNHRKSFRTKAAILQRLSLQLPQLITAIPITAFRSLETAIVGQQNIYSPAWHFVNCAAAGSHIIRFSNGRSPYITKQDIL